MRITQEFTASTSTPAIRLPLFSVKVAAGMPLPADDHTEDWLDLNEYLVHHPAHTFFVRVQGESMLKAGIFDGDLLIVDRAVSAKDGSIVLARLNGEFTVKRLKISQGRATLLPENPAYPVIEIDASTDFEIWGVVTNSIHPLK